MTCPTCREEAELRAFLASLPRLPLGKVAEAKRLSLFESVRRFRRASPSELDAAAEAVHRDIDSLVVEAGRSSLVERMTLVRAEERVGLEVATRDDASAFAWRSLVEVGG